MDQAGEASSEHPLLAAAAGTLGLRALGNSMAGKAMNKQIVNPSIDALRAGTNTATGWLKRMAEGTQKLSSVLSDLLPEATDTVVLPKLDIDKIAERIGRIIVEG
jgi:hypothetical protein